MTPPLGDRRRMAMVSMASIPMDVAANARKAEQWLERASAAGAQLALFPELTLVGQAREAWKCSLTREHPILLRLAQRAEALNLAASVGFFERETDKYFVSQAFLHQGRVVSVYRKIFCCEPGGSDGETFEVVDWEGVGVGTAICKDLHFPDTARECAKRGALIILHPAAYREPAEARFEMDNHNVFLPRARAKENGVFYFLANASGNPDGNMIHLGNVIAAAPDGRILARLDRSPYTENLVVVDIDLDEARKSSGHKNVQEELARTGLRERIKSDGRVHT